MKTPHAKLDALAFAAVMGVVFAFSMASLALLA